MTAIYTLQITFLTIKRPIYILCVVVSFILLNDDLILIKVEVASCTRSLKVFTIGLALTKCGPVARGQQFQQPVHLLCQLKVGAAQRDYSVSLRYQLSYFLQDLVMPANFINSVLVCLLWTFICTSTFIFICLFLVGCGNQRFSLWDF